MDKGIRSRSFLKTATVAATASVAAVLLLLVPAAAEHTFDTDVRISADTAEVAEGGRFTLSIGTVDGQPAAEDLHVYLAIDGTATEGNGADFTITGPDGRPLPDIGDTLYDRKVTIPQGSRSVTVRINTRNDREAEQCEVVRVQGLQRRVQDDVSHKAFVGILEYRIVASDFGATPPQTLPSVDVTENGDTWTATLTDPGGVSGTEKWFWHRATRAHGPWTQAARLTDRYTLRDEDRGYYLRAEARYTNGDSEPACAHVIQNGQGEIINPEISGTSTSGTNQGGGTSTSGTNQGGGNTGTNQGGGNTGGGGTSGTNQGGGSGGTSGNGDDGTNVGRSDPANPGDGTTGTDPDATDDEAKDGEANDDEESFSDLDTAGEHTKYVRILYGEGVLDGTGCSDRILCANGPLLRWEAAVWFVRVLDGKNPENTSPIRFTDVDANVWYAPYIERLAELKVTVGCSEDPARYCPDKQVTRAQIATLLVRAFGLPEAAPVGFTDTDRTVHAPNIDASYAAGVTGSCSDEPLKFCPWEDNSRAEVATYLVRARTYAAQ